MFFNTTHLSFIVKAPGGWKGTRLGSTMSAEPRLIGGLRASNLIGGAKGPMMGSRLIGGVALGGARLIGRGLPPPRLIGGATAQTNGPRATPYPAILSRVVLTQNGVKVLPKAVTLDGGSISEMMQAIEDYNAGRRQELHGGIFPALFALALPAMKALAGAIALGGASAAGNAAVKKLIGDGSPRDQAYRLLGGERGQGKLTPLGYGKLIRSNKLFIHQLRGGSLGSVLGRVWKGLSGIVTKHGVSTVKNLLGSAKNRVQQTDFVDLLSKDRKALSELAKEAGKKLKGTLGEAAKNFGKTVADKGTKAATGILADAAERKLDSILAGQKKKPTKKTPAIKALLEDDAMETTPPPTPRKRKRVLKENPSTGGFEMTFAPDDELAGSGKKRPKINNKNLLRLL